MPKIHLKTSKEETTIEASPEKTILDNALEQNVHIRHACDGKGECCTCAIEVTKGHENLTPITEAERQKNITADHPHHRRLSCQCRATGDVEVTTNLTFTL